MSKADRRSAILDAVISLLASHGLEGVTHRRVDEAAGLPQGSTTYYFPKKTGLLRAAADHLAVLLGKDCDELQLGFAEIVAQQGMDAAIAYVGEEVVSYAESARVLFLARIELTMASARREDLAGVGDELSAAARRPIAFFLSLINRANTDMPIETCAALIDGITLMHVIGQGPKPTSDQIRSVFRAIL